MMVGKTNQSIHKVFVTKKKAILDSLELSSEVYTDASPKGSVDEEIRPLLELINGYDEYVTTSSCAGRITVFAEKSQARKHSDEPSQYSSHLTEGDEINNKSDRPALIPRRPEFEVNGPFGTKSSQSGKGSRGRWLFVSHSRINTNALATPVSQLLGLQSDVANHQTSHYSPTSRFVHFKFEPMVKSNPICCDLCKIHDSCWRSVQYAFG